jgi:hypothetical protein
MCIEKLIYFFLVCNIVRVHVFKIFPYHLLNFIGVFCNIPFSPVISLTWIFSFLLLVSLAKYLTVLWVFLVVLGFEIQNLTLAMEVLYKLSYSSSPGFVNLLIFSENQLLSLMCCFILLVSIQKISPLIFIISFCLLFVFSKNLRHIIRLFIWDLSIIF